MHSASSPLSFGLAGRRAVVTGHRGGIGGAVASLFAAEGCEVIGLDLPDFDLADPATVEARAASLIGGRPVDILVNCAGVTVLGSVLETDIAEAVRVFAVNFLAPYALIRAVLPGMIAQRRGAVVNVASDQALIGKPVSAAYGASKAAIAQLTRSAALDWAGHNIRFNCVAPGSTDTAMLADVIGQLAARYPERFATNSTDAYTEAVPLRRFAAPTEIAAAIAFLASDAASFITGVILPVDGGTTAA
jgi:NAD(P)-dependent dehydrogenase (short-subunit alcohol dehydrogenase family)